jgi:hypothetical protein
VNCAALPRELVESELFGYARGAHSQAAMAKPGIIEQAEGGTLFLDEIGEMAPELQTEAAALHAGPDAVADRRRARAPHRHAHHRRDQPHDRADRVGQRRACARISRRGWARSRSASRRCAIASRTWARSRRT